jgi:hypothetical protein
MKKVKSILSSLFALTILLLLTAGSSLNEMPMGRGYSQMTYDSESKQVVLYGGSTGYWLDPIHQNRETWLYDPVINIWEKMNPVNIPDGSSGGDMVYDSKADRSILSLLTIDWSTLQTWAYDANSDAWSRLADGPLQMVGQRLAYDAESDKIIMFGGFTVTDFKFVDETWVYDFNTNTWTNMQPRIHPSGRNYIGMVYDSKADRVVLWGDWQRNYTAATDESVWTYDYNTNTWQEFPHKKDGPNVRDYTMLAYDEKADRIIMYGGYTYGNSETWVYDLNTHTWRQMSPLQNPGELSRHNMIYIRDVNRTMLYGGQDGPYYFQYKANLWLYSLKFDKWMNALEDE